MFRPKWFLLIFALSAWVLTAGCDSEHTILGGSTSDVVADTASDSGDLTADTDSDTGDEEGSATVAACDGQTGVSVSGTVDFEGTLSAAARLWLFWRSPAGGIPPCSMEIKPAAFPSSFRFEQVPDQGWTLVSFIDVDGAFPPIPASGDYVLETPAANLDLSGNVEGLVLTIPTTTMP